MEQTIHALLKKNQLSVTASRHSILQLFMHHPGALAHADIEKMTASKIDRVTVYRTLQTFVEKGIIHTIPSTDNNIRYALCKASCADGHHHDHHVHFECERCHNTTCLDEVDTPVVRLPRGFRLTQTEVVIKGVCRACNA
jgi:Fur family transcriptional regulator, ferric uptake regulator